jgi:hypothetical protein
MSKHFGLGPSICHKLVVKVCAIIKSTGREGIEREQVQSGRIHCSAGARTSWLQCGCKFPIA